MTYICPECGCNKINIVLSILTEQPVEYLRKLPRHLDLNRSPMGSWVNWDDVRYTCEQCRYTNKQDDKFLSFD